MKKARILICIVMLFGLMACSGVQINIKTTTPAGETQAKLPADTAVPTPVPSETPTAAPAVTATIPGTATATSETTSAGVQTSQIVQVRFFSATEGWGVDSLGNILNTTQGMLAWKNVSPPGAKPGVGPSEVTAFFLDTTHAWAIYRLGNSGPVTEVMVWSTTDGGQNWKKADPIQISDEGLAPVQLFFVDPSHGWFLGQIYPGMNQVYTSVYATQDGGATWAKISDSTPGSDKGLPGSYSLPYGPALFTFLDETHGFAGGQNLYQTTDGGKTWTAAALPDPPDAPTLASPVFYVSPPQFSTPQDGILTYTLFLADNVFCPPCDVSDKLPAAIYIYTTHDAGKTWNPVRAPENTGLAGLVDAQRGWFVGRQNTGALEASIYTTSDGGATWNQQAQDSPVPVCARLEYAGDTIYAQSIGTYPIQLDTFRSVCGQPFLYESKDGGKTWNPVLTSPIP
jgi:photosystem II stability/assembly factor-like uncharacterized protein